MQSIVQLISLILACVHLSAGTGTQYAREMDLGGALFLVNRSFSVSKNYVPPDLVIPQIDKVVPDLKLRREVAAAAELMFEAASADGLALIAVSGYRSYGTQAALFQRKIGKSGSAQKAQRSVAPPGTSEHQLGLALDIGKRDTASLNQSFDNTPEGQWIAQHAHEFGFIVRYQQKWTKVTGYQYEPWHVRFVGVEHAKAMKELDLPLELYVQGLREAIQMQRLEEIR